MNKFFISPIVAALFFSAISVAHAKDLPDGSVTSPVTISSVSCEFRQNPLGVDVPNPRLGWILRSGRRGVRQTAYRVLAASSAKLLEANQGDLWDSGKIQSDAAVDIHFAGKPLASAQEVFWKVRSWDDADQPTPWSAPATWTMGIIAPDDWQAKWIGAASAPATSGAANTGPSPTKPTTLLLRRDFTVKPNLRRAMAFICGLGQYELSLNGSKVGPNMLAPGWTNYNKTCLYDTHDITAQLKPGANAAGIFLGNGMYNVVGGRYTKFKGSFGPVKAIALIRLEYNDGATQLICTDESWRAAAGPITFSDVYGGEDYDARLYQKGWDQANFDASAWAAAQTTEGPGGALKGISVSNPPILGYDKLQPVARRSLDSNTTVYDLGQNAAIMPTITVHGGAGCTVRLLPGELLKPDGTVDQNHTGRNAYWEYTLASGNQERYTAHFYYCGCRYLQAVVSSPPNTPLPVVDSIIGATVHADAPPAGDFKCSNVLFNRIHQLVRWAQLNNMTSIMTDCPHREKLGWLEEDHLNGPALRYNFNMRALFTKITNDMADSQLPSGLIPNVAPDYVHWGKGDFYDSPEWSSAFLLVPWQQYEFHGDLDLVAAHYDAMCRYVEYLGSKAEGNIVPYGLGDWYDIGPGAPGVSKLTPKGLTATAFYYQDTIILSRMAKLLGRSQDVDLYEKKAAEIRQSFNAKFFNRETKQYGSGSQCANAIPLVMNLADPQDRAAVLQNLVNDVQSKGLTAGDVGYRYMIRALADGGRSDVLYQINNQSEKPGYGMQLKHGATSLTEAWDANPTSSQDHFMLGQINEWFYHDLAGIQNDPSSAGFKKILLKPTPVGDLTAVNCAYQSDHGPIVSDWKVQNKKFALNAAIPPNTTATIILPTTQKDSITESNKPLSQSTNIRMIAQAGEREQALEVDSGTYHFECSLP